MASLLTSMPEPMHEGLATEKEFLKSPRHAVEVHYYPYLRKLQKLATG